MSGPDGGTHKSGPRDDGTRGLPVIILNPTGANGHARRLRPLLDRAVREGRATLALTKGTRDAERLAREAALAGCDVVAVGGDGTVNEVATGILDAAASVCLGIVPAGTGNDYAYRTLKLPHDPARALEVALSGMSRAMDAGSVNSRYFLNALGVGLDANIAAAAERMKRVPLLRGEALYYAASLTELIFHYDRCPTLTFTADGEPPSSRQYAVAAISIGPTYGGGFQINPGADPCDGLFDLCTITKPGQLRALRLLPMIEQGKHLGQPEVTRRRVRAVTLEARQPIYAHLDGEIIRAARFEVRILPGAMRVRQDPRLEA
ncbi:MAG: diacylglycerol/lipid kinase family protein [Ktedonobacterales bacterium]